MERKFIEINGTRYVYTIHPHTGEVVGISYFRKDGLRVGVKKHPHAYSSELTTRFSNVLKFIGGVA